MACCMVYSIVRRTTSIGFPYKRRYLSTEFVPNTRLDPLIERLAVAFDEEPAQGGHIRRISSASTSALAQEVDQRHASKPDL